MGANWTLTIRPYPFASVVDGSLGSRLTVCDMFLDELHGKIKLKRFPSSQFTQFRSKVRHLVGMVFGYKRTIGGTSGLQLWNRRQLGSIIV